MPVLPTATAKHFNAERDDGKRALPMQWAPGTWEWWCPKCRDWLRWCRCRD